jgi:hypothetical protein
MAGHSPFVRRIVRPHRPAASSGRIVQPRRRSFKQRLNGFRGDPREGALQLTRFTAGVRLTAYGTSMEKKLFTIGNSVALVIDKPLRRALGIEANTIVRLMTDGQRLIIEPCGERTIEAKRNARAAARASVVSEQKLAHDVAYDLLTGHSMPNERFVRLTAGWRALILHIRRYEQWTLYARWEHLTDAERRGVRRFGIFHAAVKAGEDYDEAIEIARKAEPFDSDDPDERDAGNEIRNRAAARGEPV